jgi:hypothetical protein
MKHQLTAKHDGPRRLQNASTLEEMEASLQAGKLEHILKMLNSGCVVFITYLKYFCTGMHFRLAAVPLSW